MWDEDPARYITRALSPAKVTEVKLLTSKKSSIVIVPDNQLSLAIGKEGQNARLAARLTGWKVDIKSETQAEESKEEIAALLAEEETYEEETYDWEDVLGSGEELTELAGEDLEVEDQPDDSWDETDESWDEEDESWAETDFEEDPDLPPAEVEGSEEVFIHEEPKKKKTKKRAKQRVKELIDEVEEGIDLFIDASQDSEPEVAIEDDTELVFTEESGSGFTIGQLLSEELKKKFSLNEEEKKKK